jgi:copper(I)-binding protein
MIRFPFPRVLRHAEERVSAAIFAAGLILFAAQPVFAHGFKAGQIEIGHPWLRMTPPGAKVGGGYASFDNEGKDADTLVSASVEVAGRTEIHEMSVKDGVMTMRPLPDGVALPPGEPVKLAPGGFHLMLFDLKQPLKEGESYKGTLTFAKAGRVDVVFNVEGMAGPKGANAPAEDHSAHVAPPAN